MRIGFSKLVMFMSKLTRSSEGAITTFLILIELMDNEN